MATLPVRADNNIAELEETIEGEVGVQTDFDQTTEIGNLASSEVRRDAGQEASRERRQGSLDAYIDRFCTKGRAVDVKGLVLTDSPASMFWNMDRTYVQYDGASSAWITDAGIPSITRKD